MNISAKNPEIVPPVPVPSSHPLYVLYTSGTTGKYNNTHNLNY